MILCAIYAGSIETEGPRSLRLVGSAVLLGLAITGLRYWAGYDGSLSISKRLSAIRWVMYVPLACLVFQRAMVDKKMRRTFRKICVGIALILAAMAALYVSGIATISSSPLVEIDDRGTMIDIREEATRYGGPVGGANVLGMTLTLMYAALVMSSGSSALSVGLMFPFVMIGIASTQSRQAILWTLTLTIGAIFWTAKKNIRVAALTACICFAIIAFMGQSNTGFSISETLARFKTEEIVGVRWDKMIMGGAAVLSSPMRILIGAPGEAALSEVDTGLSFSDNSFIQMILVIGVPGSLAMLYVWGTLFRIRDTIKRTKMRWIICLGLTTLLVNNAILWDLLICFYSAIYWMVFYDCVDDEEARHIQRWSRPPLHTYASNGKY